MIVYIYKFRQINQVTAASHLIRMTPSKKFTLSIFQLYISFSHLHQPCSESHSSSFYPNQPWLELHLINSHLHLLIFKLNHFHKNRTTFNLNDTLLKKFKPNHLSATHLFQTSALAVARITLKLILSEPAKARTTPKRVLSEPVAARITPKLVSFEPVKS